jgi:hypothetical protein
MSPFDLGRATRVRSSTEALHNLFIGNANRLFFLETAKRQPDIGSGRPGRAAQQRTQFSRNFSSNKPRVPNISSDVDLVLLGYWWDRDFGYTCSGAENRVLRAVSRSAWVKMAVTKENAWRLKGTQQELAELVRAAHHIRQAVDAEAQMNRLTRMLTMCSQKETAGEAFPPDHAEGQLMALLMGSQDPPKGEVNLYLTRSPCDRCSRAFAGLHRLHSLYGQIIKNPQAHKGGRDFRDPETNKNISYAYENDFKRDYEQCGFDRWKIGWILYGAPYEDPKHRTDFAALDRATRDGSISGHRRLY